MTRSKVHVKENDSRKQFSLLCKSLTVLNVLLLSVYQYGYRAGAWQHIFAILQPSHFWTRDNIRSVLPGLWRKRTQWSKVLFSDKSKFCISFGNQGPRVWRKSEEAQNPCCLKSSVKFTQSVMIWAAMSSAGVGPLCFLKSTVNAAIYQEILEHFMLPSADKLYGDADLIFQQDLTPAHTAKGTKSWFNDHGVGVLDWPANSPDLNPIENLWGIVKRRVRDTRPNNADELKATVKETWASIPPQQCHKLITSMPRRIEAVIKAKGAPTKYWVHIQWMNILSRRPTIH